MTCIKQTPCSTSAVTEEQDVLRSRAAAQLWMAGPALLLHPGAQNMKKEIPRGKLALNFIRDTETCWRSGCEQQQSPTIHSHSPKRQIMDATWVDQTEEKKNEEWVIFALPTWPSSHRGSGEAFYKISLGKGICVDKMKFYLIQELCTNVKHEIWNLKCFFFL